MEASQTLVAQLGHLPLEVSTSVVAVLQRASATFWANPAAVTRMAALLGVSVTALVLPAVRTVYKMLTNYRRARRVKVGGKAPANPPNTTFSNRWFLGHSTAILASPTPVHFHRASLAHARDSVYLSYDLFHGPNITVADPKALQTILSSRGYQFAKLDVVRGLIAYVTGDKGLLVIEGDEHRRHRRLVLPLFNAATLKKLTPTMHRSLNELETILDASATKGSAAPVEFQHLSIALTLNVIGRTAFATDFAALGPTESPLTAAYNSLLHTFGITGWNIAKRALPFLGWLPLEANRELVRDRHLVTSAVEKIVHDLSSREGSSDAHSEELDALARQNLTSLVQVLLENQKDGNGGGDTGLTLTEIRDELLTFLLAGHETTSNALSMTLYFLGLNPDVQETLYRALVDELPEGDDISLDDANQVAELHRVVNEGLRLHSPVFLTVRKALNDNEVTMSDGRTLEIPAGAGVLIPIQAMHLDKQVWGDDAESFRPDRWKEIQITGHEENPAATRTLHPLNFMPFLAGPRACIGRAFAIMELKLFLARLVRRYRVSVPESTPYPAVHYSITARPVAVPLVFERR
ncbi:hypothetical protein H9P43_000609 [Blastocladiella emersonii ATCC 22665]|nr:hypothetical protein H9P43_000609 [Blastocladiella emersonii ATCC 22665]